MNKDSDRIPGRILAVEDTANVSGARPTSPVADIRIDVNGNPDPSPDSTGR